MTQAEQILPAATSVVVVDWPSQDVPETLARAGLTVMVKGGPEPDNYSLYEWRHDEVVIGRLGHVPEHADLVYAHRPVEELAGIVALAVSLGATAVWCQSGLGADGAKDPTGCWVPEETSRQARRLVESAGLAYVDDTYIADAARRVRQ